MSMTPLQTPSYPPPLVAMEVPNMIVMIWTPRFMLTQKEIMIGGMRL
jgi:hypothetical protein